MKKIVVGLLLAFLLIGLPSPLYASEGLVKPSSKLYFLQTFGESVRLFFTFSKEEKLNYLLQLTERRVEEIEDTPSPAVVSRYEEHFQKLNELSSQAQNREQAAERIREASLRQQEVLARVYNQVPEPAKEAILNAQENSSKHVERTIEAVEGSKRAQEYIKRVERIQQLEKLGQLERLEPAPMEASPQTDPSQSTPQELRGTSPLREGQELRPINPALESQGDSGGNRIEPVQPIQRNAPASQN
jgi:hypothetical protein